MFIQLTQSYIIIYIWLSALWFPVAHCVFLIAFCTDLDNTLCILNEGINLKYEQNKAFSTSAIVEVKKTFGEIIRFQCDAKQFSENIYLSCHKTYHTRTNIAL